MICCDVDGVILNIGRAFTRWYNKRYKGNLKEKPYDYRYGLNKEDSYKYYNEFFNSNQSHIYDFLFPDVKEYFNKLCEKNVVWLVTAFPKEKSQDRVENLQGFNYSRIKFRRDKLNYILNTVRPTICIEDKPELIKELHYNGIKVYYPNLPYTQSVNGQGIKFCNWQDLYKKIEHNGR